MYRVFCESYENYLKQYESVAENNEYRHKISKPFELICDLECFRSEQSQNTLLYQELCDLLYYMANNLEKFPGLRAFLWTLDARGIEGKYFGVVPETDLEEQTKLVCMFLNLLYWDEFSSQVGQVKKPIN
jgi:hypothetical protein